jgi:hypothetical protein
VKANVAMPSRLHTQKLYALLSTTYAVTPFFDPAFTQNQRYHTNFIIPAKSGNNLPFLMLLIPAEKKSKKPTKNRKNLGRFGGRRKSLCLRLPAGHRHGMRV